jgi:hypothetical protein
MHNPDAGVAEGLNVQIGVPIADGPKTTFSPFSYRILRFYSVTARISSLLKRAEASYAEYGVTTEFGV